MAKGGSGLSESAEKPLGGGGGKGGPDPITVQPFRISPENLKAAIGQKGSKFLYPMKRYKTELLIR